MKRVVIFMPAYNAEKTVKSVWVKIPEKYKNATFLVDDNSQDQTYETAKKLGIESYKNETNLGYGGNVKFCLKKALDKGADIIIEMHPDNEYDPSNIDFAVNSFSDNTGMILGNRKNALRSGMYLWKYIPSKILTFLDNLFLGTKLSDLHQGFRLYSSRMLKTVKFQDNSNSYLFSFEIIAQTVFSGFSIDEINVNTLYTGKKRGASLKNSLIYSVSTFYILLLFLMAKLGIKTKLFSSKNLH